MRSDSAASSATAVKNRISDFADTDVGCLTGVLSALQRCLLEAPRSVSDLLDRSMAIKLLKILEDVSLLLLAVLYGDPDACVSNMGNGNPTCVCGIC